MPEVIRTDLALSPVTRWSVRRYPHLRYAAPARGSYHFFLHEHAGVLLRLESWHTPRDLERERERRK